MPKGYGPIAWLVNHEMLLLSAVVCIAYYVKLIALVGQGGINVVDLAWLAAPVPLLALTARIASTVGDFSRLKASYGEEWEKASLDGTDDSDGRAR